MPENQNPALAGRNLIVNSPSTELVQARAVFKPAQWAGRFGDKHMATDFESKFAEYQSEMVSICMEFCESRAELLFIYICHEGSLTPLFFYKVGGVFALPHEFGTVLPVNTIKTTDLAEKEGEVIDILIENTKRIRTLCKEFDKPMPTEFKLIYDLTARKLTADYKYDEQLTTETDALDNFRIWYSSFRK